MPEVVFPGGLIMGLPALVVNLLNFRAYMQQIKSKSTPFFIYLFFTFLCLFSPW